MPILQVDTLAFDFDATVAAEIYDRWDHYTKVWNVHPNSQKAVDVVAVDGVPPQSSTWLIEAKDFRAITNQPKPSNIAGLAQYMADKVTDTLAGLADAGNNAAKLSEKQHAQNALASADRRIVLHLEPHTGLRTALFPAGFSASVLQKLRQLSKPSIPTHLCLISPIHPCPEFLGQLANPSGEMLE